MSEEKLLQIQQLPGYVKDTHSGAILNTDVVGARAYKERKKIMQATSDNNARLDRLEGDLSDIKTMLAAVLNKIDKTTS